MSITMGNKKVFKPWMFLDTPTYKIGQKELLILAVLIETKTLTKYKKRAKAYLIRAYINQQKTFKYQYVAERFFGFSKTINRCSRKQFLQHNDEFQVIKQAAHLFHQKIHKQKDVYHVVAEFFRDELVQDRWHEATSCKPCQVPFLTDPLLDSDFNLRSRLNTLEME